MPRKTSDQESAPTMDISSMPKRTSPRISQLTINSSVPQPSSYNAMSVSPCDRATRPSARSSLRQLYDGDIDLLLIGRSGNGKSATGNSILGKDAFSLNTRASSLAVSNPVKDSGVVNGKKVTIVDGLNIGENNGGDDNNIAEDICALTKAFQLSEQGFSAVLIVLKFGVPYSMEETNALKIAKTLLGENVIRDYGICVVTHGDNFQHTLDEEEEDFKDFEQWCKMQKGDLNHLFVECQFRCVMFNNRTKQVSEKISQVNKVYGFLEKLSKGRIRGFTQKREGSTKTTQLMIEKSFIEEGTTLILENIRSQLKKIENSQDADKKPMLESMLRGLSEFSTTIQQPTDQQKREHCTVHIKALAMEINGIMKNLGPDLENKAVEYQQCNFSCANKSKESDKNKCQRESSPKRDITETPSHKVSEKDNLNSSDRQRELPRQQVNDMTSFDRNPTKFLKEGGMIINSLRIRKKEVQESFHRARKTYSTSIHSLLQETKDLQDTLQTNSHTVSQFKYLQNDAEALGRDLESMLEIPLNGGELYGHERQVKKIKIADKEDAGLFDTCSSRSRGVSQKKSGTEGSACSDLTKTPAQTSSQIINLLIVGCTGNGKSSTGNSILGENIFSVNASTSGARGRSVSEISRESSILPGQTINVIDVPGVSITGRGEECIQAIIEIFEESLEFCNYEFSALLFVLKFGVRFTNQETEMVRLIRTVLGQNVFRDFGICIVTHGDNFEQAVEEAADNGEDLTFGGWCRGQTGDVKSMIEECNFRCVLFDNKTKDLKKKRNQLRLLLQMIDPKKMYSKQTFVEADVASTTSL